MKKLIYILLSCVIFTFVSCQTLLEDVNLPYQEQLVVTSFISPQDTIIEVKVSKTSPTVGKFSTIQPSSGGISSGDLNSYRPLNGVSIEISDGTRKVAIPLSEERYPSFIKTNTATNSLEVQYAVRKGYFLKTKDFPIVAGKTYTLTAKYANLPPVTALCTVPQRKLTSNDFQIIGNDKIDSVRFSYSSSSSGITNESYTLNKPFVVRVKDFLGEENFYTVAYYSRSLFENKDQKGNVIPYFTSYQEPYSDFIRDYKRDGETLEFIKAKIPIGYYYSNQNQNQSNSKSIMLQIHVAIIDKPYYEYAKSITKSGSINNDDPFSEAVITYTNVQGGLGVFASYNNTVTEFKLK
jgi:hypothetical protein